MTQDRLRELESALVQSYDAGDMQAVELLAAEIERERGGRGVVEGPLRAVSQGALGFNEGLANVLGAPVSAANLAIDLAARPFGARAHDKPFLGQNHMREMFEGAGFITPGDEPRNAVERVARRTGQEVAYALPAVTGAGVAAQSGRMAQAVDQSARAGGLAAGLVNPALQQARNAPAGFAAAEGASALLSGAGAGVGREVDGERGEIIGQIAAPLAGFGVPATVRSMLRGSGEDAAQTVARNVDAFERAGTSPTMGQATTPSLGEPSGAARVEGLVARTPGGVSPFRRTLEGQQNDIAIRIEGLADSLAPDARPEAAGRSIREGVENFVTRSRERANRLYDRVDELVPDATPTPMENTRRIAQEILDEAPSGSLRDDPLLNDTRIRSLLTRITSDEPRTYRDLRVTRSRIGRLMNDQELVSSRPEIDRLYGALTDDIAQVAAVMDETGAEGASAALHSANRFYAARQARIDDQLQPIVSGDRSNRPEDVFRYLERGAKDGATRLRTLRRSMTDDEWAPFSAAVMRRLGTANPAQQGAEGMEFSTETFLTNWNRLAPEAKQALFGGRRFRGMRRDLDAIAQASESIRAAGRAIQNPSGTGEMVLNLTALTTGGGAAMSGNLSIPALLIGGMATSNASARLMTNRRFVRWLAQSTKLPVERLPSYLSRLSGTIGEDPQYAADVAAYVRSLEGLIQNADQDGSEGAEDEQQKPQGEDTAKPTGRGAQYRLKTPRNR